MMFSELNINPYRKITGDCVVRAIGVVMDSEWDDVFLGLVGQAFKMKEMPSDNDVWSAYLRENGFSRHIVPDTCPDCYTVRDFANDHPQGRYVLGTGTHAIGVVDWNYFDTFDSGDEPIIYLFKKEN